MAMFSVDKNLACGEKKIKKRENSRKQTDWMSG